MTKFIKLKQHIGSLLYSQFEISIKVLINYYSLPFLTHPNFFLTEKQFST